MDPKTASIIRQVRSLLEGLEAEPDPGPTFADALETYERDHLPTLTDNTRRSYLGFGRQLRRTDLVGQRLGEITTAAILAASEISSGPAGRRALAKHVGRVYLWADGAGLWSGPNPAESIRAYRSPVPDDALDESEIHRLVDALHDPDNGDVWKRRAVFFLALQPWRSSEALDLRIEHVRGTWAHLPRTKSGARRLALSTPARELIERASAGRMHGLVFRPESIALHNAQAQVRRVFRRVAAAASLTVERLHALRHSGATNLQALGVPIADVGALLGHASTSSTLRYLHRNPKRQRAAIEQLGAVLAGSEDA